MIKLVIMDVDGTLTDGSIYYSDDQTEIKKFNVKDAAGIMACQSVGKKCVILTGRESYAVERRAKDLNIEFVYQEIKNKRAFLKDFVGQNGYTKDEIMYIGDDLNDLGVMKMVGKTGCPADAAEEIKQISDYISMYKGGHGAVRDILFSLLKSEGLYEKAIENAYGGI